ncbi:MAG: AbrB family transcriptional regulator [Pseudomonadota bacterium]
MGPAIPYVTALVIGVTGGFAAYFSGLPLPWMLGPMIANTGAALLRVPIKGPVPIRPYVIPVLGVLLGSGITAEVLGLLRTWVVTLAVLPVFLACAASISFAIYRRVGRYDTVTAFYAAMPGGLNEMLIMGVAAGGDERRIAMAHAARVLLIIVFVALYFGFILGVTSGGPNAAGWVALDGITARDYAILAACAVCGAIMGKALRLPAAPILGPMILSGLTHVTGWVTVAPPTLFVILAQITIGTIIGTRFVGSTLADLRRDLGLAAISSFLMLLVAVGFAELIFLISGIPLAQGFLAYSPGGLAEMSILALAMEQDATYVSVMHIIRITLVIALAPLVFRVIGRNGPPR